MSAIHEPDLQLGAVDEALAKGWTIPASWYADASVYSLELERIFGRAWTLVGPEQQLANPGDHIIAQAGHVPVVVTRDLEGELHGFVNVCRHRAYPVATEDGCRKLLQCAYHAWTYELDGRLNRAPRAEAEPGFDKADFSLVPVSVDTWGPLVWVNPDPHAPPLREAYPGFESLAAEHGMDFSGYTYHSRSSYSIPANWKVWVENASECYHCPTIHQHSFSDAYEVAHGVYEYRNEGKVLCQLTPPNAKGERFGLAGQEYRYWYLFPSTFLQMDDFYTSAGRVHPTGVESCVTDGDSWLQPGLDPAAVAEWDEMWRMTMQEDIDAVAIQQPNLRSGLVPHGRLMPSSESAIAHFHRLCFEALRERLA
jgi:phenylpropionate dioxygenase-like ring-hydroxylating dioxygenase large terminal subunit